MEKPSKAFLRANAIICSDLTNKFVCAVCPEVQNLRDWKSHVTTERHITMLERFARTFEDREDIIRCKTCEADVEWTAIKTHGRIHMIVPWHDPDDKYKIFYENHTLKFGSNYYCYLCDEIFQEWLMIYTHIGEEKHRSIMQEIRQSVPLRGSKKFYGDLMTSGFVPGVDGVECRFCGEKNLGYHNTDKHSAEKHHALNKSKFTEDLSKRIESKKTAAGIVEFSNLGETSSEVGLSKASMKISSAENTISKFHTDRGVESFDKGNTKSEMEKPKATRDIFSARNMICNFQLDPESADAETLKISDLRETRNAETATISLPRSSISSDNIEKNSKVYLNYIVSNSHDLCNVAKSGKQNNKNYSDKFADQTDEENCEEFCLICCHGISGLVQDHSNSEKHAEALKNHGCENLVVVVEGECYYCGRCDCTISGIDDVYRHVLSDSHARSIAVAERNETVISGNQEFPNINHSESQNESCIYIVRRNAKKSFCEICDSAPFPVASKNIKDHIVGQRHKLALLRYGCENIIPRNNYYHCRCCNLELADLENVYLHIKDKRHTSSIIKVCNNKEEIQTRKRIRDKVESQEIPEEFCQPPSRNLLSDYIVNRISELSGKVSQETEISEASFYAGRNLVRSSDSSRENSQPMRIFNQPIYMNGSGNNSAQSGAVNSWCFPRNFAFPQQSAQITQQAYHFDNSSISQPAARGFSRFPYQPDESLFQGMSHPFLPGVNIPQMSVEAHHQNLTIQVQPSRDFFTNRHVNFGAQISLQPPPNSMISSMNTELSRFSEQSECKNSRGIKFLAFDERAQIDSKLQKIYCNLCNSCFEDVTELHVHMAGHFAEEFLRPKRNRYANSRMGENHGNLENPTQKSASDETNGNITDRRVDDRPMTIDDFQNQNFNNNILYPDSQLEFSESAMNFGREPEGKITPTSAIGKSNDPRKSYNSPMKMSAKKLIELLDFNKDYIYEMEDKLADLELGIRLCLTIDSRQIYCLICRKIVACPFTDFFEHLNSVDHCEYLEAMERDCELFADATDQFSDFVLAQEYIEELSDDALRCFVCDREIINENRAIEEHIYEDDHARKCEDIRSNADRKFEELKRQIHCDWYNVQKYWCVVCSHRTDSEASFVNHLESRKHQRSIDKRKDRKRLIFDFCAPCSLLWYGYRCTHSYHSEIISHQWLARDGYFVSPRLPKLAISHLEASDEFIETTVRYLDEIREAERGREQRLIGDMEKAVKMRFPKAKAHIFGSRVSGLGSTDSDVDVYLSCHAGNAGDGKDTSEAQIEYFMTGVHRCLTKDAELWDVEELLLHCRSPIIKVHHRATGLNCDLSFLNGLSVENTKLIKTFNDVFPMCRKLILFLKQWLAYCDLSGSRRITSYALYWYIIFYLQKESILPGVARLIAMSNKSRIIAGWETSFSQNFTFNQAERTYTFKEYLIRFFKFYANFDFRHCVACPLLGEELSKKEFTTPRSLPDEMLRYVDYLGDSGQSPEPFRIDSVMCIQDPIDLQHNLTKAVSKVYLNRFRKCCSKSLDLLCSN